MTHPARPTSLRACLLVASFALLSFTSGCRSNLVPLPGFPCSGGVALADAAPWEASQAPLPLATRKPTGLALAGVPGANH